MLHKPEKKKWLEDLILNLESEKEKENTLSFKIVDIKEKGFSVKIGGLFAFIGFEHMPWRYRERKHWEAVSPHLIGRVFFGKIFQMRREPSLSIIVDAAVPQFKRKCLDLGEIYSGVVVQKSSYGIFIDLGVHFDWRCGSIVGLLHRSQYPSRKTIEMYKEGDLIQVTYQGLNDNEQYTFGWQKKDEEEKITEKRDEEVPEKKHPLIDKIVWARVEGNCRGKKIEFWVKGKYASELRISNYDYSPKELWKIIKAMQNLKSGDVIICKVLGYNSEKDRLEMKWMIDVNSDALVKNSIMNIVDPDSLQKLIAAGELEMENP